VPPKVIQPESPCGNSVLSHLDPAEQGVTLSLHPDTCSPAPLFDRVKMRVLVLKILKGRAKVLAAGEPVPARPDGNYTAHIYAARTDSLLSGDGAAAQQMRFKFSQIYLYEYGEKNQLVPQPTGILPWAAVSVSFGSSSG